MPRFTSFLELTLGQFNEFSNSWHNPVNQNFEDLDDWLADLYKALITGGASDDWEDLVGDMTSLAARLNVSINADGTIDPTNSPEILNMSTSAVEGEFTAPRDRLDAGDFRFFDARQPFPGGRFAPVPAAGPSAGYPYEQIDSGIAFRAGNFSSHALASPRVPWSPGLVAGGAAPMITGLAIGQLRISADSPPAVFNIDGYLFRLREIIDLDYNLLSPSNGQWVWIFVDRDEANYGTANYRYTAPSGGAVASKDLRKLQTGSDGVTSGQTFSAASALFNTKAFGKVRAGDTLVITAGAAAGSYVIDALDLSTPDTKFTIKGTFKANLSGVAWYVHDKAHPNIGAVVTTANVLPAFTPGRVFIARCVHSASGAPTSIVTFRAGGVYDTGWVAVDASTDFPLTLTHNLGAVPTTVEIWCRTSSSIPTIYPPKVLRTIVTEVPGPTSAGFMVDSFRTRHSDTSTVLVLQNASTLPLVAAAIFTDSSNTDQTECEIRVIVRK